MTTSNQSTDNAAPELISIADYEPIVCRSTVDRILSKAKQPSDLHVVNVSSTYYVGGVAEMAQCVAR
jgi:hypothetical protein